MLRPTNGPNYQPTAADRARASIVKVMGGPNGTVYLVIGTEGTMVSQEDDYDTAYAKALLIHS